MSAHTLIPRSLDLQERPARTKRPTTTAAAQLCFPPFPSQRSGLLGDCCATARWQIRREPTTLTKVAMGIGIPGGLYGLAFSVNRYVCPKPCRPEPCAIIEGSLTLLIHGLVLSASSLGPHFPFPPPPFTLFMSPEIPDSRPHGTTTRNIRRYSLTQQTHRTGIWYLLCSQRCHLT